MYVRFVQGQTIEGVGFRVGFLNAAYQLRDDSILPDHAQGQITDLIDWFKVNLDTPDRFNKSKSKGSYRRETKGLSWFKPSAINHIEKAREIIAILHDHDILIETLRTDRVGYVIYEDAYQVVAEPFSDTPR